MPDSSSNSISFLTLRISMPGPLFFIGSVARRATGGEVMHRRPQRELVADRAKAGDLPDDDIGEKRVMRERLASMHVREMHFDERQLDGQQRVAQCDARVGEPGWVEDDDTDVPGRG